jgi:hypothetical protein
MTVSEAIAKLAKVDPDALLVVSEISVIPKSSNNGSIGEESVAVRIDYPVTQIFFDSVGNEVCLFSEDGTVTSDLPHVKEL